MTPRRPRRVAAAATLLLLGLGLVACAGSDNASSEDSGSLSAEASDLAGGGSTKLDETADREVAADAPQLDGVSAYAANGAAVTAWLISRSNGPGVAETKTT